MKITLILPKEATYRHKGGNIKRSMRYAPLTLTTLAALIPSQYHADIRLIDEGIEASDKELDADLIGISAVTAAAPRAYYLADLYRKRGITVVLGGVHPTLMPEEAAQHADAVVCGFAEESWPQLLEDFSNHNLKRRYIAEKPMGLDNLPLPRRDLLKKGAYFITNTIQASQGCPNKCNFCVIPEVWGHYFYHRPIAEVIREIASLGKRRILFLDPSLVQDAVYAKELFRAMIPLKLEWAGLATVNMADDKELMGLAMQSGCRGILLGFESIEQQNLMSANKRFNNANRYTEIIKVMHDYGISVLGCFMFGFDHEDESIFERTVRFVEQAGIDAVRYAVFTPFPGTPIYNNMKQENRIIQPDWSYYDNEHVVFTPKNMSAQRLQEGLRWAWDETYRAKSIMKRMWASHNTSWRSIMVNLGFKYYAKNLPAANYLYEGAGQ